MILKKYLKNSVDFINQHKNEIKLYAETLKSAGGFNDYYNRLAFDIFYYQQAIIKKTSGDFDFDLYQEIANICKINKNQIKDNYIITLYKQAIKQSNILQ